MPARSAYRPDIDGLRGVAVLLVLGFHFFPYVFPAGFVGVDIFFVISGFLIGGILIREARLGSLSLLDFYSRRAVRILPAFLLVMGATWLLGWTLFFSDEYRAMGKDLTAASLFVSNFRAWGGAGYFADDAQTQPALHLWSLGIEEQFYLIVPLIVGFLGSAGSRLLGWVLLLMGASFGLSWYASVHHPSMAFYWPITRAWELLAGVGMAIIKAPGNESSPSLRPGLACTVTILGWSLLGAAILFVKEGPGYPGLWALLVVIGTLGVINAGEGSGFSRRILASTPLRWVGLISYPLYLWHWPLWVALKLAIQNEPGVYERLGILAVSFALASLTVRFIERPIRESLKPVRRRAAWLLSGLAFLFCLGLLTMSGRPPERLNSSSAFFDAVRAAGDSIYPFADNFRRSSDFTVDASESTEPGDSVVLFAGDSHMQHFWARIQFASAESPRNKRMKWRLITAGGSPMLPGVNRSEPGYGCDKFFDFILSESERPEVKRLVLSCFWEHYLISCCPISGASKIHRVNDPRQSELVIPEMDGVLSDLETAIRRIRIQGKDVVIILSSPASDNWAPRKIPRWSIDFAFSHEQSNVPRSHLESIVGPLKAKLIDTVVKAGGRVIDPYDYFAENDIFSGHEADGRFRYKDSHHFRPFYAAERATFIDGLLQ